MSFAPFVASPLVAAPPADPVQRAVGTAMQRAAGTAVARAVGALAVTTQDPVTGPPPFVPQRLNIPGAANSGAIICLDPAITFTNWKLFLEDVSSVAQTLGVSHFVSRSSEIAPYFAPNASPPNHRHHLMSACRRAQREQGRWPQFIIAVIPDNDSWQVVQHFCVLENAIAVQCIYGAILGDSNTAPTRVPAIARALSRVNVKLGGYNVAPMRLYEPIFHTLLLGAAMEPLRGAADTTFHCSLVGSMDYAKHRWYTATSIQTATTHRIIHFDTMLISLLDLLREPISRIVIVRAAIPPTYLENTILYGEFDVTPPSRRLLIAPSETDQVKGIAVISAVPCSVMNARCGIEPRIVVAVPWDADHDASSAEDYTTAAVGVGSKPFAIPFNEFGGGWDTSAIGTLLTALAFDFAIDNRPSILPAPLKYATAAAASFDIHYISGRPKHPSRPYQGYKTLCRQMASTSYWL
ncbi:hypothetical protein AURDEDRAFT_121752 [Auricularia subglabra TFB-10046 SS5]|nr:hypothetical protein AURDEDRAFT_121752 [Auricularia subglabra TFB-10046 SS5]